MIPPKPSARRGPDRRRAELAVHGLVAGAPVTQRLAAPSIVLTIESAVASARARGRTVTLDRSNLLVAARGDVIAVSASGPASRVAVLGFHPPVVAAVARAYARLGLDRERFARWLRRCELLPRTVWIHELVHRYVFERHALGERDNLAIRFLEIELAKELYFLFRDREAGAERASAVRAYSPPVERALRHIEAHVFDPCNVAALARTGGASASTLLRLFQREVGCSPGAYWRNRKLDEAVLALRAGKGVAEVAARIGYENPTAFGFAFRRRFGAPPSAFRPRGRVRAAP